MSCAYCGGEHSSQGCPARDVAADRVARLFGWVERRERRQERSNVVELRLLAKAAVAANDARRNEDIRAWADRLAADVAHLND